MARGESIVVPGFSRAVDGPVDQVLGTNPLANPNYVPV